MVAYPSASPRTWRPTSRALGALFAGSAVMFGTALFQGGSLLAPEDQMRPAAEPLAEESSATSSTSSTGTAPNSARTAAPAELAPGKAAPWTPGATPDWGSPLSDLPVRRAPVQEAPARGGAAPATAESAGNAGGWQSEPPASRGAQTEPGEHSDGNVVDDMLGYLSGKMVGR